MYRDRADTELPAGRLDKAHYYALHRHLFQDVYDWAGKPRSIRIGKGNWFCFPDFIDQELDRLFASLEAKRHLAGLDLDASPARPHGSSPRSTPSTPSEKATAARSLPSCGCFASMSASPSTRRSSSVTGSSAL